MVQNNNLKEAAELHTAVSLYVSSQFILFSNDSIIMHTTLIIGRTSPTTVRKSSNDYAPILFFNNKLR